MRSGGGENADAPECGRAVLIVGNGLLRESVAALLEKQAHVTVVGACEEHDAIVVATRTSPDIVIIEMPLHRRLALSCLPALSRLRPSPRVILLTRNPSREQILAAIDLGVDACVAEQGGSDQLLTALAAVRRSQRYIGPIILDILQRRDDGHLSRGERFQGGVTLTPRERQVMMLIARGESERTIAMQIGISRKTVHAHRTNIMHKLGVHNAVNLVRRAIQLGLVDP